MSRSTFSQKLKFQFLIGRLDTHREVYTVYERREFQFLIGRLDTNMIMNLNPMNTGVSIPYR